MGCLSCLGGLGGETFGTNDTKDITAANDGLIDSRDGNTVGFSVASGEVGVVIFLDEGSSVEYEGV